MTTTADDDAPVWLQDYHPIEADLSTLAEFARALRDELTQNFVPHARRLLADLDGDTPFVVRDGFVELEHARDKYSTSRDRAIELLNAYAVATQGFADAADKVAKEYRDSDAFAAATLRDVQGVFADPTTAAVSD
jgi:hypothetical protein